MPPRRDLRNDASVPRMQLCLRRDDVGQHMPVAGDESACRLVARGLEGEDQARSNFDASTTSGIRGFRVAPHDQSVFAIVGVIAAADPTRAEAETLEDALIMWRDAE